VQILCQVGELGPNSLQEFGIVYSASNTQPTTTDSKVAATGSGNAVVTLANLQPGTLYYYRAYTTNTKGIAGYGTVQTFTTSSTANTAPLTLYIGSTDNFLYAVDPNTGFINWKFETRGGINSSPVVVNERLFFGSNDNFLYAIDPVRGTKLWSFDAKAQFNSS